ncbi:flavoprotein [Beggiatoa leptomitoformis]|uniref:Flavoprotein n=1 Tax=Beggiatoa leptomitoformis TaxID=288004 RepID=A0A2N9YBM8_9GAMM|nr:flavoprotein [Beggiatoa leptomitoformis]ALG66781.1 flavoprotein [Beggiatoa leptomitoformis]AUI67873.1 flavoprotein [Beggiatoa leptomitoformis]
MSTKPEKPRFAWAFTGSGHYLTECLTLANQLQNVDFFFSKAAYEVFRIYELEHHIHAWQEQQGVRIFRDTAASAPPVGLFYRGDYHTLIIAPATSNTVAKCVVGISDTLVTNIFAQAGKCLIPSIVFACDTEPVMETPAPDRIVKVYPRKIDLENTERLCEFERTTVVKSLADLERVIKVREGEL